MGKNSINMILRRVTILLPLMLDDASSWRSFLFFIVLLAMVIFLMIQSDLFYQNPVLVALRYKFFEFKFISPNQDVKGRQTYLGLSRGGLPREGIIVKRKGIADGVFLIDNDEKGERKESV